MNDFLQSLRNGQAEKQRTPKTRKNFDNSYNYTGSPRFHSHGGGYQNTRNQQMKRPPVAHQPGNNAPTMDDITGTSMLAEAVESLSRTIETLTKNQDYLLSTQERTSDMLERQAIAIEKIATYLNTAQNQRTVPSTQKRKLEHNYITSQNIQTAQEPVTRVLEAEVVKPKNTEPIVRRRKKIIAKKTEKQTSTTSRLLSRESIMDIIQTMRKEGATYDQIAGHLVDLGQPTFSGRGEWHAQTIHRLCSKK